MRGKLARMLGRGRSSVARRSALATNVQRPPGPHSLTHAVAGKTRSRFLTVEQTPVAQQPNCGRSQLSRTARYLLGVSEAWADGHWRRWQPARRRLKRGPKRTGRMIQIQLRPGCCCTSFAAILTGKLTPCRRPC
jgi:hypothetical protein